MFETSSEENLELKKLSKWVFITTNPFHPDDVSSEHLEKINSFWGVAALNDQLALLKCRYQKED